MRVPRYHFHLFALRCVTFFRWKILIPLATFSCRFSFASIGVEVLPPPPKYVARRARTPLGQRSKVLIDEKIRKLR